MNTISIVLPSYHTVSATKKCEHWFITQDENLRRAAERVEEKARWEELEQEANAQELRFRCFWKQSTEHA